MAKHMFDRIEDYLEATLPEEERLAFEQELMVNAELKEEVELEKDTRKLLDLHGQLAFKEKLQLLDQQMESAAPVVSMKRPLFQQTWFRVAAVLLILLISGYFWTNQQYQPNYLAQSAFEPYRNLITARSGNSQMQEAMAAYDREDYEQAIPRLQKILTQNPQAKNVNLYLGISLLAQGQAEASMQHFDVAKDSSLYVEQANWYKVLACLQVSAVESCEKALRNIADKEGPYQANAQALLQKLTGFWGRLAR